MTTLPLPDFITDESLAAVLQWPPSHMRKFRDTLAREPIDGWSPSANNGTFYQELRDLLAKPGGTGHFEDIVKAFDGQRARGLLRRVTRRCIDNAVAAGEPGNRFQRYSADDLLEALIDNNLWGDAAWLAWLLLSLDVSNTGWRYESAATFAISSLVEIHDELALELGDFWGEWCGLTPWDGDDSQTHDRGAGDDPLGDQAVELCGEDRARSEDEQPNEDEDLLARWQIEANMISEAARAADAFSSSLQTTLEAAAIRIGALVAAHAAAQVRVDNYLRAEILSDLESAVSTLSLCDDQPAFRDLGAALAVAISTAAGLTSSHLQALGDLAEEAAGAARMLDQARAAVATAELLAKQEDSSETDAAWTAARTRFRAERTSGADIAAGLRARLLSLSSSAVELDSEPSGPPTPRKDELARIEAVGEATGSDSDSQIDAVVAANSGIPEAPAAAASPEPDLTHPLVDTPNELDVVSEYEPAGEVAGDWSMNVNPDEPIDELETWVGQLDEVERSAEAGVRAALETRRYGLAAHIAQAASSLGAQGALGLSPVALRSLAVGAALTTARLNRVTQVYAALEPDLLSELELRGASASPAARLTIFAGALRPAIFSSQTAAGEVLRRLNLGDLAPPLHELCRFVSDDLRRRGVHLTPQDLAPQGEPTREVNDTEAGRAAILQIAEKAPQQTFQFSRATAIWKDLFRKGDVAEAIVAIRDNRSNAVALANKAAAWLDDDIERRLDTLDREHWRRTNDEPVVGGPRARLLEQFVELAEMLRHWAAAQGADNNHGAGRFIDQTLHDLKERLSAAREELQRLGEHQRALALFAREAQQIVERVLDDYEVVETESALTLDMLLDDDLLLFENPAPLYRTNNWSSDIAHSFLAEATEVASHPADFATAFERCLARADFDNAHRILRRMVADGGPRAELEALLEAERETKRADLLRNANDYRRLIDDLLGADTEAKIDIGISADVDGVLTTLTGPGEARFIDFLQAAQSLADVREAIDRGYELLLEPLRQRIAALEESGGDVTELRQLEGARDMATLSEHLTALENGVTWSGRASSVQTLRAFANTFLTPEWEKYDPAKRALPDLIAAAGARRSADVVDFSHIADHEVQNAVELLEAWRNFKSPSKDHIERKTVCPLSRGGSPYTTSSRVARRGRADPHRRRTSLGAVYRSLRRDRRVEGAERDRGRR